VELLTTLMSYKQEAIISSPADGSSIQNMDGNSLSPDLPQTFLVVLMALLLT
jgi:hypothetical protein